MIRDDLIRYYGELPKAETVTDRKTKIKYYNLPCAFDIETTNIVDDPKNRMAFPYHMQLMIGSTFITCRTIEQLGQVFSKLQHDYNLNGKKRLIMYVHNLPFEFQFIRCYFHFNECMSKSQRQVMKVFFDQFGIEMRDSYVLSGMSLEKTAENLTWPEHSSIRKLKGDLDYKLIRFPSTKITKAELDYCYNDVKIICCYIEEQIKMYDGDITKIPLTNTGRVRRHVRKHCFSIKETNKKTGKKYPTYKKLMNQLTLEADEYGYLLDAFLGGYTHANAMYSTKLLKDVHSIDFTSSYPTVMMSEQYPMSKGIFIDNLNITSYDDFVTYLSDNRLAVVMVEFTDLETKPEVPDDYLSDSRVYESKGKIIQNNGRIHKAEWVQEILTNIDLDMVVKAYSFTSMKITSGWFYYKNYLPREIIECVLEFYWDKTTLKGIKGKEAEYLLKKGMLNSLYGMCVTDICKDEEKCTFENGWKTDKADVDKKIADYNKDPNRFLSYAWGVFITAYARRNLFTGIMSMGKDYVYCDTDSIKFLNMEKHKAYIEDYNRNIIRKCTECLNSHGLDPAMLAPKNQKGVEKQIGIWDYEGRYDYFKTLGCKRYLTYKDGEFDLTCAGLPTKAGLDALLADGTDIQQVFNKFNQEFDVPVGNADKLGHDYVDKSFEYSGVDKDGNYDRIVYRSCCVLFDISFKVNFAEMYQLFLDNYVRVVTA